VAEGPAPGRSAPGGSLPGGAGPVTAPAAVRGPGSLAAGRAREAAVLAALAVAVAVLGVPLGLVWAALAPDVPVVVTGQGPVFADPQPEQPVAADGWFALVSVPFGVLVAVGVWAVARRRRGPYALAAVTVGAVAAGLVAWWWGRRVGLAGYESALADASTGTVLSRPQDLRVVTADRWPPVVLGVPLVPGLVAAATYTLLAAWSRFPDLRPEDPTTPDAPGW
jgi:hypothetical protein